MRCSQCGGPTEQLFTSVVCANDCANRPLRVQLLNAGHLLIKGRTLRWGSGDTARDLCLKQDYEGSPVWLYIEHVTVPGKLIVTSIIGVSDKDPLEVLRTVFGYKDTDWFELLPETNV